MRAKLAERRARPQRSLRHRRPTRGRADADGPPPARPTWPPTSRVPDAAVLGHPGGQGHRRSPTTRPMLDERATVPRPVGAARRPRRRRAVLRGAGRDRGPAAAAVLAGPAARPSSCCEAAVVYGYFPASSEGDDLVVLDEPAPDAPERVRFTFPRQRRGPAPVPGRLLPARERRRRRRGRTWCAFQLVTMGQPIARPRAASCSPRTPTATTWSCTGCRVQLTEALAEYWHRRVRQELGFAAGAPVAEDPDVRGGVLRAGLPRRPLLASATAPARTSRTARRSSTCWSPSASASSCPRSSSCTPSSPPTRIVLHHPEAKYFNT